MRCRICGGPTIGLGFTCANQLCGISRDQGNPNGQKYNESSGEYNTRISLERIERELAEIKALILWKEKDV